ncbi:MAG: hypothetical protein WD993_05080 [Thermoleophilaceae bacterium]
MKIRTCSTLLAVAAVTGAAVVPPASAQDVPQTDVKAKVRATPTKAGTTASPRGHTFRATVKVATEPGFDPPIVTGAEILVGRGVVWNGDDYAKCSKRTLDRRGPEGCPRKSIMGAGTGTARADTVITKPDFVFVNAGAERLYVYTTLYHPALVQETLVIRRKELRGRWRYHDTFRVPKSLQVVAGVPIQVTGIRFRIGGKPYARKLVASTSCPRGGWRYRVKVHYLHDLTGERSSDVVASRIACRR